MRYFKNTELAKMHRVSEKAVRNWILAGQQGKIDLELLEENGKAYVANTAKNTQLIGQLVERGKKYKNSRGFKVVDPSAEFYSLFSNDQIRDIASNITLHQEIPLQYGYVDGGAASWDLYSNRLFNEESPNILRKTTRLLDMGAAYIDQAIGSNQKVNVVDLGPGNGLPIRATLERLLNEGRLNRYIAIDISREMLAILEKNINEWFDGKVRFESYVRNFAEDRFDDLFYADYIEDGEEPVNLVFILGGTLNNFRLPDHVLRVINMSLGGNDLLFYSGYLDTPYTQRYFDLSGASFNKKDPQQSGLIPHLLGIDEELCDFELLYSKENHCRFKRMVPKLDISIKFALGNETRHVELHKNEPVLLWRHRHYTFKDIVHLFDRNDFDILQATKSEDRNYILLISRIKTGTITPA